MPATITPAEMLQRLVAFDTTSRNPNAALIAFCAAWFEEHGASVIRVAGDEPGKENLYATFGPMEPGGVVLSGHTDVVPVDGQEWSTDPWTLTAKEGRLYGRGAADMKGFCATVMALAPRFAAARLTRPIHIAFSYDEEVGCIGVRPLIAHLTAHLPKPALAIIGEPTMMRPVNAHKGARNFEVTVTGRESHSSAVTKGVNAVMIAAELIMTLKAIGEELRLKGDPSGRFDPPCSTIACNMISGGTAMNITAGQCRFHYEIRDLPFTDDGETIPARFAAHCRDTVLPRMRAIAPEAAIAIEAKSWIPGLAPEPGNPAEALVLHLSGQNAGEAVAYGTEAGLFQAAGIPAVICGPGDIAQAHAPDEFIAGSQLDACADFLERLVRRLEG